MRYVVDTNIWIRFLKKERSVRPRLERVLASGDEIVVTPIVYYELLRGLEKRRDTQSIGAIKQLWSEFLYVETSRPIWDEAIRLWVLAIRKNEKQEDADTLIAAFASHLGAVVVTDNEKHFAAFGLTIENWAA